jgi:hypothetical protein
LGSYGFKPERGAEIRWEAVSDFYGRMEVGALPSMLNVLRALADQLGKPGVRYAEKEQDLEGEVLC